MRITAALMLKAPRPGTVKTRLAADLGSEPATAVYRRLVEHQLREIPQAWACAIYYAPSEAGEEMRQWLQNIAPPGTRYEAQCEGDLGTRMLHAVKHGLADRAEGVVLLGGHCPELFTAELLNAARQLQAADIVIAPALDGGYVLLALKQAHSELFEGIPWSTPAVRNDTLSRAAAAGLKIHETRYFADVDDSETLLDFGRCRDFKKICRVDQPHFFPATVPPS